MNELAWEMWEICGQSDIDPSVLSRVINGERRLSPRQLAAFTKALGLSQAEDQSLKDEYCREVLSDAGLDPDTISTLVYKTDTLEAGLKKVESARTFDSIRLAYMWIIEIENDLKTKLEVVKSPQTRKRLLTIWGGLLVTKVWITLEYRHQNKIVSEISEIPQLFEQIATATDNSEFYGSSEALRGRISFETGNYAKALEHDLRALRFVKRADETRWVYGRIAQTYAVLGQTSKISAIEDQILHYLPSLSPDEHFLHYRNMANTYAIAKDFNKSSDYLSRAWQVYETHSKLGDGNYKNRAKITLYHAESSYHHYFGRYHSTAEHFDRLETEAKSLSVLFGYHQYQVEPGRLVPSKLL